MNLTIKSSQWIRGEGDHASFLLRPSDGKRCCLGILAKACNISNRDIEGLRTPEWATIKNHSLFSKWPKGIVESSAFCFVSSNICDQIMQVNDSVKMPEKDRRESITKLFSEIDITVSFEDQ